MVSEKERNALLEFHDAAFGQCWPERLRWNIDGDPASWSGVRFDKDDRVVGLEIMLYYQEVEGFQGEIHSWLDRNRGSDKRQTDFPFIAPELVDLDNLEVLRLRLDLQGAILESLGQLGSLQTMDLFGNQLSGAIPESLGQLASLETMYLGGNQLSGAIPESLGQLGRLTNIYLGGNQLSGTIPESLGQLASLETMDLGENQLSGAIPESLGRLGELRTMYLPGNQLSGAIPESLGQLGSLQAMDLRGNQLSGAIPESLGELGSLQTMDLGENQLSGAIPESLGELGNLQTMDLGKNQLSGAIPESLGELGSLETMDLGENQLSGAIPESLGQLGELRTMDLRGNQLSGAIPESLDQLGSLETMDLRGNQLSEAGIRKTQEKIYKLEENPLIFGPKGHPPPEKEGSHPRPEQGSTGSQLAPEKERSHPRPEKGSAESELVPKKEGGQLPPQQEDIKVNRWEVLGSQEVLTSLICCDWMQCLRVCKGARNLVRDHVSQVMVGLPALPSGWTVPLDILRIRTNGQGKRVLLAPDYGVSIESPAGVPDEDVEGLTAILIPPSARAFLTVGTQDFFACSPILRCTWKRMTPHPNVPWAVRFPMDEETCSCTTPGDIGVLHRSFDSVEGEWEELNVEIRQESMRAGVEFEVPHFSDIITAVKKATLSERKEGYIMRRRPIFSITTWTSMARTVRIFNHSSAKLSFLQVPPSQIIVGRSGGVNANVPFVGGGGQRSTTLTPPAKVQKVKTLDAYGGKEPLPVNLCPIETAKSMRLVIYTTNDTKTRVTFREMINDCRVGTDVILLDGMQHKETDYGTREVADGNNVVSSLLEVLKDQI